MDGYDVVLAAGYAPEQGVQPGTAVAASGTDRAGVGDGPEDHEGERLGKRDGDPSRLQDETRHDMWYLVDLPVFIE